MTGFVDPTKETFAAFRADDRLRVAFAGPEEVLHRKLGQPSGRLHAARIAVQEDCTRFQWSVLDWNQPAIDFYESLGVNILREWITCRVEGEAIAKLAD